MFYIVSIFLHCNKLTLSSFGIWSRQSSFCLSLWHIFLQTRRNFAASFLYPVELLNILQKIYAKDCIEYSSSSTATFKTFENLDLSYLKSHLIGSSLNSYSFFSRTLHWEFRWCFLSLWPTPLLLDTLLLRTQASICRLSSHSFS